MSQVHALVASGKSPAFACPVPRPIRAFRDRHERWARDPIDAFASTDERCRKRTAKSCGPDVSTLTSSWQRCSRIAPGTETTKPDLRPISGEHEGNHNTMAAGNAGS